jgi:hypothetical protein
MQLQVVSEAVRDLEALLIDRAIAIGLPYRKVQIQPFFIIKTVSIDSVAAGVKIRCVLAAFDGLPISAPGGVTDRVWYYGDVSLVHTMLVKGTGPSYRVVGLVSNTNDAVGVLPLIPVTAYGITANENGALSDAFPGFWEGKDVFFQDFLVQVNDAGGAGAQTLFTYKIDGFKAIYS